MVVESGIREHAQDQEVAAPWTTARPAYAATAPAARRRDTARCRPARRCRTIHTRWVGLLYHAPSAVQEQPHAVSAGPHAEPAQRNASGWHTYGRLLVYVRAFWPAFALSIVGFVLYALSQSAFASLMQYLPGAFDSLPQDAAGLSDWERRLGLDTPAGTRRFLPLALLLIVALRGLGSYLGGYYITFVARNVVNRLRLDLFAHLQRLPASYLDQHNSSQLVSLVTFNVEQVTSAASNAIKVLIREGLTVVALLAYLLYLNWKLSLLFLAVAPLIGLIIRFASRQFKKYSQRIQHSMGDITQVTAEALRAYPVVRSFGGVDYENQRFAQRSTYALRQDLKLARVNEISTPVIQLLTFSAIAALFWLGLDPQLRAGMSAGEFLTFITAASLVAKPLRQLSNINAGIQRGIAAAESIFSVLDEPPESERGGRVLSQVRGEIACRNLSFNYPGASQPTLRDIDLSIPAGATVALVGRSGAGKSTLAGILAGLIPAPAGTVRLDDIPLEQIALGELRRQVAIVSQHTTLFEASIADNIAYGELRGASRERIAAAAREAHAMEFIAQLPAGLDTLVSEDASDLSGGQRQRLALARAFLKESAIIVLDEATSALDPESEQLIRQSLARIAGTRTTVVIAHRLSSVENADCIVVMDGGRIVERGRHLELLARDGAYAQLLRHQQGEVRRDAC